MSEHIRVVLPQKYDLVVGDTFQLFYRGVVEAPNPYCYDILSVCEKGRNFPRYFEFLPEEPGEYDLTIFVCGPDSSMLMPAEDKPVNIRSKQTEHIGINGNHPLPEGYMQIADAAFRNMVHLCKEQ